MQLFRFAILPLILFSTCSLAAVPADEVPTVIPLTSYLGAIPSFTASAAGTEQRFLLDTAGGITVVTPAFAKQIGCTPWGQITGFRMRGDRIDGARCDNVQLNASGSALTLPSLMVWDLASLLPADAPPLAGSVALDAFQGQAITLDLAGNALIVETKASLAERIGNATEIPVRFSREAQGLALVPMVAVQTPHGDLWMELDSGSDAPMIVNRTAARALGFAASTTDPAATTPSMQSILVGGTIPIQGMTLVQDLILDGNIGAPILRQWRVTIDLANERLWIAPRSTPSAGDAEAAH